MAEKLQWDYVFSCDPIPQQIPKFNKLSKYYENMHAGKLTTTQCTKCGKTTWPPRSVCPVCMSDEMAWIDLPEEGTIVVISIQDGGAFPGFVAPLIFAMLKFGDVSFMAKIIDVDRAQLAPGKKVRFKPEVQYDGRILPAFTLV